MKTVIIEIINLIDESKRRLQKEEKIIMKNRSRSEETAQNMEERPKRKKENERLREMTIE